MIKPYYNTSSMPRMELAFMAVESCCEVEEFTEEIEICDSEFMLHASYSEFLETEIKLTNETAKRLVEAHGAGDFRVECFRDDSRRANVLRVILWVYKKL